MSFVLVSHAHASHNPAMLRSVKLLALLRDAQTAFPRSRFRTGPPLELKIEVLERLPTIQEVREGVFVLGIGITLTFHHSSKKCSALLRSLPGVSFVRTIHLTITDITLLAFVA